MHRIKTGWRQWILRQVPDQIMRPGWYAYEHIEVGGVIVNDVSTYRIDHMPYGGVKQSGFGREGVKYAIEEMTEPKLLVMNVS